MMTQTRGLEHHGHFTCEAQRLDMKVTQQVGASSSILIIKFV